MLDAINRSDVTGFSVVGGAEICAVVGNVNIPVGKAVLCLVVSWATVLVAVAAVIRGDVLGKNAVPGVCWSA